MGYSYSVIRKKLVNRNNNLEGVKSIIRRKSSIGRSKKYIQELELSKVPLFKGFKWIEVDSLLNQNIGVFMIANLKSFSRKNLLVVNQNNIIIPNRKYLITKYVKNPLSYFLVSFFISLIGLLIQSFYYVPSDGHNILILIVLMFVLEVPLIYYFDSLLSFNDIKKSEDVANNRIMISENFGEELKQNRAKKLKYYQNKHKY